MNIDFTHGLIIVSVSTTSCLSVASGQWSLALGQLNVACQFTIVVDLLQRKREGDDQSKMVIYVLHLPCLHVRPCVRV